jgi:hypothetical protein
MKMVKSLLLGSAAGLVAVAGAQAADLPVKAKPVQYVKICTLYGDGFYYIPGSDTCLKIMGYVRVNTSYNGHDNVPHYSGASGANTRKDDVHRWTTLARINMSTDARTQTPYGTLRSYTSLHVENTAPDAFASAINEVDITVQRAFIQWAGFTIGRVSSLADVPGQMGDSGMRSLVQMQTESTTGASGINELAYTWEFGGGARLNIGVRERLTRNIYLFDDEATAPRIGSGAGSARERNGQGEPSPFISMSINQAWGSAGVGFVAQKNAPLYFRSGCDTWTDADDNTFGTNACGHADDTWGFGGRAGAEFKLPMLGPGDRFLISGYYSVGAVRLSASNLNNPGLWGAGEVGFGWGVDSVIIDQPGFDRNHQNLTTAWSINAGFEHYLTPNFSAAVYAGYADISYNDTVIDSGIFCASNRITPLSGQRCDPSHQFWQVGGLLNWFPAAGFRLALNVVYSQVETAMEGLIDVNTTRNARPTGTYTAKNMGTTTVMFRGQRNFGGGD